MITSKDIIKAHKVLKGVVVETPLDYDHYLSEKYGAKIYLKKENAQRVRSFKIRGAYYAISQLHAKERERGVVCASAGNHAQGVAYTCREMKSQRPSLCRLRHLSKRLARFVSSVENM